MKTLAIIQARMSSSRLPGKVLLEMGGKPMLQHVIERTRLAHSVDETLLATTSDPSDDPLAEFAARQGIPCSRGSLHDVLDRYYQAARPFGAQAIVRVTADCPLIDPEIIDQTVNLLNRSGGYDFACNRLPPPFERSFPIGLDVEVCTFSALETAWREARETFHREHVLPFLYEGTRFSALQPGPTPALRWQSGLSARGFRIAQLHHQPNCGALRWTVDTLEDLAALREIFSLLKGKIDFSWLEVLEVTRQHPHIATLNAGVRHKTMTEVDERQADRKTGRQGNR